MFSKETPKGQIIMVDSSEEKWSKFTLKNATVIMAKYRIQELDSILTGDFITIPDEVSNSDDIK